MSTNFDHIVIGAGISGLGAAHFSARRGLSTLVLEASDRIGGCLNSPHFDALGGFWVEAGGHTCFNSYGNLLTILDDLGLTAQAQAKVKVGYSLWKNGKRRSIVSALHIFEALRAMPRLFTAPKDGRSVADYYGSVLGQRNYQDLLRHAFAAVICQPADDYPTEALFRRKPRRKEMMKAFTFAEGLATIAEAIAAQNAITVRTSQRITAIARDGDGFRVEMENGDPLRCSHLTLAVPPDVAASLLPAGFETAQMLIKNIGMAEIETLVLVFRAEDVPLKPLAGLIAVDDAFYSAVSRDFLPNERYRGFAFHFRPGVLCEEGQIEHACAVLGISPKRIVGQTHIHNRLPALRTGHMALVQQLDSALAGTRLGMTGNWFFGVSIEDALTRSQAEITRLFGSRESF
ncbi:amine oxidase [Chromatium weissei]|nr:amine oxidase [Chromatium weissei]